MSSKPAFAPVIEAMGRLERRPLTVDEIAQEANRAKESVRNALVYHLAECERNGKDPAVTRFAPGVYQLNDHTNNQRSRAPRRRMPDTPKAPTRSGVQLGDLWEVIGFAKNGVMVRAENGTVYNAREL